MVKRLLLVLALVGACGVPHMAMAAPAVARVTGQPLTAAGQATTLQYVRHGAQLTTTTAGDMGVVALQRSVGAAWVEVARYDSASSFAYTNEGIAANFRIVCVSIAAASEIDITFAIDNTPTIPALDANGTLRVDSNGTLIFLGVSAPSVANVGANSCGTTAATVGTGSGNNVGTVTVGATSGTQCRLTFTTTAPTAWVCMVTNTTTAALARGNPVTTATADLLGTFTAGDVLAYLCFPR